MIPAALSQARRDWRLSPVAKLAYQFCCEYLDRDEWRAVKVEQVVVGVACSKTSAVRALHELADAGYIAVRGEARPREYRMLPTPLLPERKARAA